MLTSYFLILDGDLITIFDSSDLSFAIQYSRVLKLQILLANAKHDHRLKAAEAVNVKNQLRTIRDQVNTLLDSLDTEGSTSVTSSTESSTTEGNILKYNKI